MKKLIAPFFAITAFMIIFFSSLIFYKITKEIYFEKEKYRVLKELSNIRGKLENSINSTFLLINGLVSYVALNPDLTNEEFKSFSAELMKTSKHIRNITLAPKNVIQFVYPSKGNESTVGIDLGIHPLQKASIEKMLTEKKTVISGPVNLIQGGKGFINRTPIFIDNEYWGVASIPINMDSIFDFAQLQERMGDIDFALRGKDGLGEKGEVFFGKADVFNQEDVPLLNVELVNGYWQLGAKYNELHKQLNPAWILYLGTFFSFMMAFLTYYFISSRYILALNNAKMQKYFNIIDEAVITSSTDLNGNIISASKAFCQISGYSKEELINKNHNILRDETMSDELYDNLWKTIITNNIWEGELKNRKKDGSFYWVNARISPIFDEFHEKIGYTSIRQDITDKKRIEELSITDGLTNIYNRRYFNEMFPKIINSAKRTNDSVAFLLIDIDNFKLYNDNYGHQKGDNVLILFAKCLKDNLSRSYDYAFRLGGEEFGIVYKTTNKEKAIEFAQKLKKCIENLKITHEYNTASPYITASMGLVYKDSSENSTIDEIYKEADDLLYVSKKEGRNKVSVNLG
ncbi:MAG: diguanylate cyclase [Arcobacteraceae bacterium]